MNEIKVKFNDPGPDRELIRKYKNFDRFMDRYKRYYSTRGIREMLYNDRRRLIYIVIILLSILLLLISYEEGEARTPTVQNREEIDSSIQSYRMELFDNNFELNDTGIQKGTNSGFGLVEPLVKPTPYN